MTLYVGGLEVRHWGGRSAGAGEVYVNTPHPDVRMTGWERSFLHRGHQASILVMSDGDGKRLSTRVYKPYGEGLSVWSNRAAGEVSEEARGYIGERYDVLNEI